MKRNIRLKVFTARLLVILLISASFMSLPVSSAQPHVPDQSNFFAYAYIESSSTYNVPGSKGDLWPSAWGDDGALYAANGDGPGFDFDPAINDPTPGADENDIAVSRITGDPYSRNITGSTLATDFSQIWSPGGSYNRKPTGMISVDGVLYCAVQDLNLDFNDVPAATICKSTDRGVTWTWDTSAPMFPGYKFTTIMFLDYGQDNENAIDGYVYAYGLDYNWRDSFNNRVPDPTELFLARVPKTSIMNRSTWQFYAGDLNGNASWTNNIDQKQPVLRDETRLYTNTCFPSIRAGDPKDFTIISQGSIVYNQPLDRYIYSAWTEYTFEFYESPTPFGPWKKFLSEDFGGYTWTADKNGGYATTIPSKYISSDGETMWVQSNTFMGAANNYGFSLRKLVVKPFNSSTPANAKSDDNLALPANAPGVVPFGASFHWGNKSYLNDGNKVQSEDSWNGVLKNEDYWGYMYPNVYNINTVVFTTGSMFSDGGYFGNLNVQVRQDFNWISVSNLVLDTNVLTGANKTIQMTFDDTWGDAVRIIGTPGGAATFTSIAELEVYYRDHAVIVPPVTNLIADYSFEQQNTNSISSPWMIEGIDEKGIDRGLGLANSGTNNAYIRTSAADTWNALAQTVAVEMNSSYKLTVYVRNSNNFTNKGYFGARAANGSILGEINFSGNLPDYTPIEVTFNTGSNTSIKVFCGYWSVGHDTWIQIDDFFLIKQ